jgi:hypothetical protein
MHAFYMEYFRGLNSSKEKTMFASGEERFNAYFQSVQIKLAHLDLTICQGWEKIEELQVRCGLMIMCVCVSRPWTSRVTDYRN